MGFRNPINGIAPSSITAAMLADGAVTGSKLAADAIDGKVITGATFRTAAAGSRVEIDGSSFEDRVRWWSDGPQETAPAVVYAVDQLNYLGEPAQALQIVGGHIAGNIGAASLVMITTPTKQYATVDADLVRLGFYGRWIKGVDFGVNPFTSGTDVNGDVTIAHTLGVAPTTVQATASAGGARFCTTSGFTATTFKVRVWTSSTGVILPVGSNPPFSWLAIA